MTIEKVLSIAADITDINDRLVAQNAELPFFLSSKQKSSELPAKFDRHNAY
jgi:hypothetical protein